LSLIRCASVCEEVASFLFDDVATLSISWVSSDRRQGNARNST
jgi:hypothetical protein